MARKVKAAQSVTACTTVLALAVFGTPAIAGAQTGATCNGLPATIVVTNGSVSGTPGVDVIVAEYTGVQNNTQVVSGGDGSDHICIEDRDAVDLDGALTILGGAGDDFIKLGQTSFHLVEGGIGDDAIFGSAGNDTIYGGDGHDFIRAGAGDDQIQGNAGQDEIWAQAGNDSVNGDNGHDFIHAGPGDDFVHAGRGDDTVFGGNGQDELFGGLGYDIMRGGRDADTMYANEVEFPGPDSIAEIPDTDGNELYGGGAADFLVGSSGDDVLRGGNGQDGVFGQEGDDFLRGGNGEDFMAGGLGNDDVRGGGHADVIFVEGPDVTSGSSGPDTCFLVNDEPTGPLDSCEEILDF